MFLHRGDATFPKQMCTDKYNSLYTDKPLKRFTAVKSTQFSSNAVDKVLEYLICPECNLSGCCCKNYFQANETSAAPDSEAMMSVVVQQEQWDCMSLLTKSHAWRFVPLSLTVNANLLHLMCVYVCVCE